MGSLELAQWLEDFQLIIALYLLLVPYWSFLHFPFTRLYLSDLSILY